MGNNKLENSNIMKKLQLCGQSQAIVIVYRFGTCRENIYRHMQDK